MNDLAKTCFDILTPQCPQCESRFCGPYRCRFSGMTHELFQANQYADSMIRSDKETPAWLKALKTGAGNG
jgi:hypothetical protein